jgi:hypothetical protein
VLLVDDKFCRHLLMVGAADDTACDLVLALRLGRKVYSGRMPRLHRLFDAQVGNVKPMLHVSRAYFQGHWLAGLYVDHRRLNAVFLHHNAYVLRRPLVLLASCDNKQQSQKGETEVKGRFHIRD